MIRMVRRFLKQIPFVSRIVRRYSRTPHGYQGILKVGHREYVGGLWEELGRLQFDFLVQEGLKPNHYLLDIGCGSLRAGIHFIPYLDEGHYLGIDKEGGLITFGLQNELSGRIRIEKRPNFIVSDSFEFGKFGVRPDYALAQSLFTHLPAAKIHECFRALREVMRDSGHFLATFFESSILHRNPRDPHDHALFRYTRAQMEEFGWANNWSVQYIGDWNHPRKQVIVRYLAR